MRFALPLVAALAIAAPAPAQTDPHQWLEEAETPSALAWVAEENAKTTAVLKSTRCFMALCTPPIRDVVPTINKE